MAGKTSDGSLRRTQGLILWAGVICGIAAAILVFIIVARASDSESDGTRSVVVAKVDIPAQSRLVADMLEVKTMPAEQANPEAFTERSDVVDRITGVTIAAGEQVLPSMVSNKAGESLIFKISPGKRAVSIEVKEAVTAGGNVQPGDTVDVVGILALDQDADINSVLAVFAPGTQPVVTPVKTDGDIQLNVTATILEGVKVLAVGQSLAESEDKTITTATKPSTDAESRPKAKSVTLEVTPQQAQLLSLADEYGVLRLSVRPFGDDGPVGVAPVITALERR